jgi:hypothetical protein
LARKEHEGLDFENIKEYLRMNLLETLCNEIDKEDGLGREILFQESFENRIIKVQSFISWFQSESTAFKIMEKIFRAY